MREQEGERSFRAEKQNQPIDPEKCIFDVEKFIYWDDEYKDVEHLIKAVGKNGRIYGTCDPSLGKRTGKGDFTAIVLILKDCKKKIYYVIAADLLRINPDKTIKRIIVARQRAQEEQERIGGIINNLLDNITTDNREFVDQRLNELTQQDIQNFDSH